MTIEQIIRWFIDTNGNEFSKAIYDRELEDDVGGYVLGKFKQMQKYPVQWMASLDPQNRKKLEQEILKQKG
jgi:predicted HTH transcriptional regulator